jgi:hypothetical protein
MPSNVLLTSRDHSREPHNLKEYPVARLTILHNNELGRPIREVEIMVREVFRATLTDHRQHRRPRRVTGGSQLVKAKQLGNFDLIIVADSLVGVMSEATRTTKELKLRRVLEHWLGPNVRLKLLMAMTLEAWEVGGTYYDLQTNPTMSSLTLAVERAEKLIEAQRRAQPLTKPAIGEAEGAQLKQQLFGELASAS